LIKILFVCTGNICRSPLAEGILREKLKKRHLTAEVDSCGFESFHVGDPPDQRAQAVAGKHGIDISSQRARLFTLHDFDRFDYIYAMDSSHFNNLIKLARNGSERTKVEYTLNLLYPNQNLGVSDPWYHDLNAFEKVYLQLDEACGKIADHLFPESSQQ
jgi:protein-tyrosine phosphatase